MSPEAKKATLQGTAQSLLFGIYTSYWTAHNARSDEHHYRKCAEKAEAQMETDKRTLQEVCLNAGIDLPEALARFAQDGVGMRRMDVFSEIFAEESTKP